MGIRSFSYWIPRNALSKDNRLRAGRHEEETEMIANGRKGARKHPEEAGSDVTQSKVMAVLDSNNRTAITAVTQPWWLYKLNLLGSN